MAKYLKNAKVTVQNGDTTFSYRAPILRMENEVVEGMSPRLAVTLYSPSGGLISCGKVEGYSKEPEQTAQETRVEQHTQVILDVLKAAETTRLNSALKREKFEADIAAQERADRIALTFAVHNAIRAGVLEEQVTETLRDDHAGYVSDIFEQVFIATNIDSVLNVS